MGCVLLASRPSFWKWRDVPRGTMLNSKKIEGKFSALARRSLKVKAGSWRRKSASWHLRESSPVAAPKKIVENFPIGNKVQPLTNKCKQFCKRESAQKSRVAGNAGLPGGHGRLDCTDRYILYSGHLV